jgi:hypothetical protein
VLIARSLRHIARAAIALIVSIIFVPPVYAICAASGRTHSSMSDEMTGYSADNRTLDAATRSGVRWNRESNGRECAYHRN